MTKGVDYSFQVEDSTSRLAMGSHYHWYQAATAVKYGMSPEDALKKLTLDAAKLLGVDEFVGSIEAGKDADLVILSGDPLKVDHLGRNNNRERQSRLRTRQTM